MTLTERVSTSLARRSSRRQFLKFATAGSLGTGLFLTRSGVSMATHIGGCAHCTGGPCNPCGSPHPDCAGIGEGCYSCANGGGCNANRCQTTGEWNCCTSFGCVQRCAECSCPNGCCHCFILIGQPCGAVAAKVAAGKVLSPCVCP